MQYLRGRSFGPSARSHLRLFNIMEGEVRRSGTLFTLDLWSYRGGLVRPSPTEILQGSLISFKLGRFPPLIEAVSEFCQS